MFGSKWTIVYVDKIEMEEEGFQWGLTDYVNRRICIATRDSENKPFPKEEIEITKLHELMHCALSHQENRHFYLLSSLLLFSTEKFSIFFKKFSVEEKKGWIF